MVSPSQPEPCRGCGQRHGRRLTESGAVKRKHRQAAGVCQRLHDVPPGEGAAPKAMHQHQARVPPPPHVQLAAIVATTSSSTTVTLRGKRLEAGGGMAVTAAAFSAAPTLPCTVRPTRQLTNGSASL